MPVIVADNLLALAPGSKDRRDAGAPCNSSRSCGGTMPPRTTGISEPRSRSAWTTRAPGSMCAPDNIESPTTSTSSWMAALADGFGVLEEPDVDDFHASGLAVASRPLLMPGRGRRVRHLATSTRTFTAREPRRSGQKDIGEGRHHLHPRWRRTWRVDLSAGMRLRVGLASLSWLPFSAQST